MSLANAEHIAQTVGKRGQEMDHVRRGTLVLIIVTLLTAALVWYYFAKVYDGDASVRGTLVQQMYEVDPCGNRECEMVQI